MPDKKNPITHSELVTWISRGKKMQEISVLTGYSKRTLETKLYHIMEISGSKTSAEVVYKYLKKGLIE